MEFLAENHYTSVQKWIWLYKNIFQDGGHPIIPNIGNNLVILNEAPYTFFDSLSNLKSTLYIKSFRSKWHFLEILYFAIAILNLQGYKFVLKSSEYDKLIISPQKADQVE